MLFTVLICCWISLSTALRSESALVQSCYNFPAEDFGKANNVRSTYGSSPKVVVNVGDEAIDFELPDIHGQLIRLSNLLLKKPVVLLWGHYTCPAFQGLNSDTMFIGE